MDELILYATTDGQSHFQLRAENSTVLLTQLKMGDDQSSVLLKSIGEVAEAEEPE